MKKYLYYSPHILTLAGLGLSWLALMAIIENRIDAAVRYSLLVLAVDRADGTLARKFRVRERFPGTSGEILDIITDLVGLTFVPMVLFWKIGLFLEDTGVALALTASMAASWKYARKEGFLDKGYSIGAPPIFFSILLFYFLGLPPLYATGYAILLTGLVLSPIKYPITSLVTTHWKPGYKSITNYLTALFFIPVFVLLENAPAFIYWIMLSALLIQLTVYPLLLNFKIIKPGFNRN
jgi:phosphatidylcholine synthase